MTDREKLGKLLAESARISAYKRGGEWEYSLNYEEIVDHLLVNGVTVKEPQKPLTVEELKEIYSIREDHVWPFDRKPPYLYLDSSIEKNDHLWIAWSIAVDFLVSGYRQYTVENYGKTWRCWAEKPTEEERKAAEWDE